MEEEAVFFYGEWSLVVLSKNASFDERVKITGSDASDGPVSGVAGESVASINGVKWKASMEWSADGGVTWSGSRLRRLIGVTAADGLIVRLAADDNTPEQGDGDYNDLIVQFTYLNREVNPLGPEPPPYSYTLPEGSFWPPLPGGGGGRGCACGCCEGARQTRKGCRCC